MQQGYDAIGRLSQMASGATTYVSGLSFNAAGQPQGFSYGNGVAATFGYNQRLQLESLRYVNGSQHLLVADLSLDKQALPAQLTRRHLGAPTPVAHPSLPRFCVKSLSGMPIIEMNGLSKTYTAGFWRKKEKFALQPLSLSVEEGEVFGFLGPNGAGKTTTLKLLMGLIFPTAGSATILGRDCGDPAVKAQIGFLPEQPYFYDHLTAGELLDYYGQLSGMAAADRARRAAEILERVGLASARDLALRKFSKGMLQRVGIAQAILHDPKVVFLDEPMSGLDPIGRREVRDLMQLLNDEGKTIFFSTHILSDAEALCDRVAILHQGELRGVGSVADLTSRSRGQVEVIWQGASAVEAVRALGGDCRATGETVRALLPEDKLDAALDALRRSGARLTAVNPVRSTLEDYFVERVSASPQEVAS